VEAAWARGDTLHAAHSCACPRYSTIGNVHFLTSQANDLQK
jgi:hypothetical protein